MFENKIILFSIAIATIGFILVEILLSIMWKKIYFKSGIPIFSKTLNSPNKTIEADNLIKNLNDKFESTGYTPSIYFKQIDQNTIAFRNKMFEISLFSYIPVMHGKISFDKNDSKIYVTGLANWLPLVFLCYVLLLLPFEKAFSFLFTPALFFGAIYFVQRKKYMELCNYLTKTL
jgi:hypothetical protein